MEKGGYVREYVTSLLNANKEKKLKPLVEPVHFSPFLTDGRCLSRVSLVYAPGFLSAGTGEQGSVASGKGGILNPFEEK